MQTRRTIHFRFAQAAVLLLATTLGGQATRADTQGSVAAQWLGHAAFKITSTTGKTILIDPYLTQNPKAPAKCKDLDALGRIDLILVTHAHGDHVGDGPALAKKHGVPLYGPAGLNDTLVALGILPGPLSPRFNKRDDRAARTPYPHHDDARRAQLGAPLEEPGDRAHGDPRRRGAGGLHRRAGERLQGVPHGGHGLFADLRFIGEYYRPDVALVPIGGHFVLSPRDAAYAVNRYLNPRAVIPMHYGTNPNLQGTPEELVQALGRTDTRVHALAPGQSAGFGAGGESDGPGVRPLYK